MAARLPSNTAPTFKYHASDLASLIDVNSLATHFVDTFGSTDCVMNPLVLTQTDDMATSGIVQANENAIFELSQQVPRPGSTPKKSITVEYVSVSWPEKMKGLDHQVSLYAQLPVGRYPALFVGLKKTTYNGNTQEILLPLRQWEYLLLHWSEMVPVIDLLKAQMLQIAPTPSESKDATFVEKRKPYSVPASAPVQKRTYGQTQPVAAVLPASQTVMRFTPVQPRAAVNPAEVRQRLAQQTYDETFEIVPNSPEDS